MDFHQLPVVKFVLKFCSESQTYSEEARIQIKKAKLISSYIVSLELILSYFFLQQTVFFLIL